MKNIYTNVFFVKNVYNLPINLPINLKSVYRNY